jgi:transposase
MATALSEDLRWRIIVAWKELKLSSRELAEKFDVGTATVTRLKKTFRDTGGVSPKPHGGGRTRAIPVEKEDLLQSLVEAYPDWSEAEYQKALKEIHGIEASAATAGRAIRRLGYSVKKSPSSRQNEIENRSGSDENATSSRSKASPLRVWFLWTKPARTSR